MPIPILLTLTLLLAAASFAQDTRPATAPTTRPADQGEGRRLEHDVKVVDPTAEKAFAIFQAARKAQRVAGELPRITSFEGAFQVELVEYDENERARRTPGRITQAWVVRTLPGEPERVAHAYRRELVTDMSSDRLVLACEPDGLCWRRKDAGGRTGRVEFLTSPIDDAVDRDRIREEKRGVGQLVELFFLDRLDVDADAFRVIAEDVALEVRISEQLGFEHRADAIAFTDRGGSEFRLWFDRKTRHPVKARIRLAGSKEWNELRMAQHLPVPVTDAATVMLPYNIAWYDDAGRPKLVASADEATAFRFNQVDEARYRKLFPPEE